MIRVVWIVVLIVFCGVLGADGHKVNAEVDGKDIQGFYFEMLLTHLEAFEARMQEQIDEMKGEMVRATTQILRRIEGIEKNIDETESALNRTNNETQDTLRKVYEGIRELAQDQEITAIGLRYHLLALDAKCTECITKNIAARLLEDQSNRFMRRMEQTTVASGMQQIILSGNKYNVYVDSRNNHGFGGNWIVFQKRFDGSVNFNRSWAEYKGGFGYLGGEHWLGLEKVYLILQRGRHDLLIVLEDFDGVIAYEHYDDFQLDDASTDYKIVSLGSYTGNAGHSFAPHLQHPFSTYDDDFQGCAKKHAGGWWFKSCYDSFLNGIYRKKDEHKGYALSWFHFRGYTNSLKSTKMMVRPHKPLITQRTPEELQ